MCSITEALDALDSAVDLLAAVDLGTLEATERYRVLERLETGRRRQIAVASDLINRLEHIDGWPPVHLAMADLLRISRGEARRRIRDAGQLSPRTALTGAVLPPELPATAAAWRDGVLDIEHVRVVQAFVRDLPVAVPAAEAERAEAFLAEQSAELRPDQLQRVADRLAEPGWFSKALAAIEALPRCRYFADPVTLPQLVAEGFVDKVLGGQFDNPRRQAVVGGRPDDRPPAQGWSGDDAARFAATKAALAAKIRAEGAA